MKMTTLCYLERDGRYLMLHRTKKENDENRDKWIGVGGKFEDGESPEDCMRREILEETGLTVTTFRYRGIVTFVSDLYPCEYMHLFTCTDWTGELRKRFKCKIFKRQGKFFSYKPYSFTALIIGNNKKLEACFNSFIYPFQAAFYRSFILIRYDGVIHVKKYYPYAELVKVTDAYVRYPFRSCGRL